METGWNATFYGVIDDRPRTDSCRFDPKRLQIRIFSEGRQVYDIDLQRCRTASELLDWILQLTPKCWFSAQMLFDLIETVRKNCLVDGKDARFLFCQNDGIEIDWKRIAREKAER